MTHSTPRTDLFFLIFISTIGFSLILTSIAVVKFIPEFQYREILVYSGVAALLAAAGSTASIKYNLPNTVIAGSAGGSAAVAILLYLVFDKNIHEDKRYYINLMPTIPQNIVDKCGDAKSFIESRRLPNPEEYKAFIYLHSKKDPKEIPVERSVGGNIMISIPSIYYESDMEIKITNEKDRVIWTSGSINPREGFMNVSEYQRF